MVERLGAAVDDGSRSMATACSLFSWINDVLAHSPDRVEQFFIGTKMGIIRPKNT